MTGRDPVSDYFDEVFATLPGSRSARRDVVAELRAGLLDEIEAKHRTGLLMPEAANAAIAEFGSVCEVVAAFRPELSMSLARRVALSILGSGVLVAMLWALAAAYSHRFGMRPSPPWQSTGLASGSNLAFHLATAALLIAVGIAMSVVAVSGRFSRRRPFRPGAAVTAAAVAGFAAIAADIAVMAFLTTQAIYAPGSIALPPVVIAGIGSVVQFALARRATHRCLSTRAALA